MNPFKKIQGIRELHLKNGYYKHLYDKDVHVYYPEEIASSATCSDHIQRAFPHDVYSKVEIINTVNRILYWLNIKDLNDDDAWLLIKLLFSIDNGHYENPVMYKVLPKRKKKHVKENRNLIDVHLESMEPPKPQVYTPPTTHPTI